MDKVDDLLQKVAVSLEKYRKNKTLVSPEDLEGKYKVPFDKLREQLRDELADYVRACALKDLVLVRDEHFEAFSEAVSQIWSEGNFGKRIGTSAFKDMDLEKIKLVADDFRSKVKQGAWIPYFNKHTCLRATAECFDENSSTVPKIYNTLVDKFWNENTGEWEKVECAFEPALLIYTQEEKKDEDKE